MNDPNVERRWPEILALIEPYGLEARFVLAEEGDVDDAIEIRPIGGGEDDDLGDIQFCDGGWFCANTWTTATHEARRQGRPHRTVEAAAGDLLTYLRKDGMIS